MSVTTELAEGVRARIIALNLDGMPAANVVVQKLKYDMGAGKHGRGPRPRVIVSYENAKGVPGGTNCRDDYDYPIMITILAADNQRLVTDGDTYTQWSNRITRVLNQRRVVDSLSLVGADHYNTLVRPGPTAAPADWMKGIWHSSLIARCFVREPREIV